MKFDNGGNFAIEIVINYFLLDYGSYLEKDVIVKKCELRENQIDQFLKNKLFDFHNFIIRVCLFL